MAGKLLTLLALFAASTLAVPAKRDEKTQTAKILYQSTSLNHVSIQVTAEDGTFLGESCSTTLNSGAFADLPIVFDVDKTGYGKVTIGATQYLTHSDKTASGGIICTQMYNGEETVTSCEVPLPAGLKAALATRGDAKCIPARDGMTTMGHIRLLMEKRSSSVSILPMMQRGESARVVTADHNSTIDSRTLCQINNWTEKIGDGNPHQNYLQTQITNSLNCGNSDSCSVGHEQAFTKSVKWQVGFGSAISKWIDGGFSVQEWWQTSTINTCYGRSGQWVAMWHSTAHTAYTVKNKWQCINCFCDDGEKSGETGPLVLFSPNQHNKGGSPWCMVGPENAFHWQGYEWMDTQGPDVRPGGP